MNILHLIPDFNFGGTEFLVRAVADAQEDAGHNVYVAGFCASPGPLYSTFRRAIHFHVPETGVAAFRRPKGPADLETFLRQFRPDIVHSHSVWTDLILASCTAEGFSQITHFHLPYEFYEKKRIRGLHELKIEIGRRVVLHRQRKRNTQYVACSKSSNTFYQRHLPAGASRRIHVLRNFCRIKSADHPRGSTPNKSIRILCVSRLEQPKNIEFAIDVLDVLVNNMKMDVTLAIAGTGSHRQALESYARQQGVSGRTAFLGGVQQISAVYDAADFLVHPSRAELFGMVLVEAMARGVPCIANAALESAADIFGTENAGYLLPINSPVPFARAIVELAQSPAAYRLASERALARAQQFDLPSYMCELMKLYDRALSK